MRKFKITLFILFLLFVFCFFSIVTAADYSINWYTIDCGGGSSAGGEYSLQGTIGQADSSSVMTGGIYSLQGGFWNQSMISQSDIWMLY